MVRLYRYMQILQVVVSVLVLVLDFKIFVMRLFLMVFLPDGS